MAIVLGHHVPTLGRSSDWTQKQRVVRQLSIAHIALKRSRFEWNLMGDKGARGAIECLREMDERDFPDADIQTAIQQLKDLAATGWEGERND